MCYRLQSIPCNKLGQKRCKIYISKYSRKRSRMNFNEITLNKQQNKSRKPHFSSTRRYNCYLIMANMYLENRQVKISQMCKIYICNR